MDNQGRLSEKLTNSIGTCTNDSSEHLLLVSCYQPNSVRPDVASCLWWRGWVNVYQTILSAI